MMLHIYEIKWNGSDKAIFYQKILERAGLSEVNQYQEVFCVDIQVFQSYSGNLRINSATGLEVDEATFVTWFLWHGIEAERIHQTEYFWRIKTLEDQAKMYWYKLCWCNPNGFKALNLILEGISSR